MTPLRVLPLVLIAAFACAQSSSPKEIDSVYPDAHSVYLDLHEHPELSGHETETAAKLAGKLKAAGYDVTEHLAGTGVVAVLKNGNGPIIMLRTELDALQVGNELPAGTVSITPGIYNTNSDSVRITIYGKGGHGAAPHTTIDPIVIAARTILSLQTIASREVKPSELAIVTVGYIRAGTKNNIIPEQAEMGLTIRTYKQDIRKQVLAAIARIAKAEAEA